MPKVTKVGKFRSKAAAKPASNLSSDAALSQQDRKKDGNSDLDDGNLSRGQRKRLAKREQYLKREKMVLSSLRVKRLEEQKNRIDGLDAIREALPSSKNLQEKPPSEGEDKGDNDNSVQCNTNKSKKDLAGREMTQMNLVLQHPSFQSDPYSTIREHLLNTLAAQAEEQTVEDKKRRHEEKEKAAEKKTLKKERLREAKFSKPKNKRAGSTLNAVKKTRRGR
uniref:Uncharacterized protein n=1 Tax=Ditylum brightwellii TaxID=49249 RepID=A0A6U3U1Y0_9STRA|mmetsp:Transcript_15450/g.22988  ORF Transcript_15450/g.22988 Transcript_15450/m.22988 type:complete len:222 (+) Transcript_15450:116-781(+)